MGLDPNPNSNPNPNQVTDAQRNDSVWLRVAGARDFTGGRPGSQARELVLQPGDNYAKVAAGLAAKGWQRAYVLKVGANPNPNPNPDPNP